MIRCERLQSHPPGREPAAVGRISLLTRDGELGVRRCCAPCLERLDELAEGWGESRGGAARRAIRETWDREVGGAE